MSVNIQGLVDDWSLGDPAAVTAGTGDWLGTGASSSSASSSSSLGSGFLSALTSLGTAAIQGFAPNNAQQQYTQQPVTTGGPTASLSLSWPMIAIAIVAIILLTEKK